MQQLKLAPLWSLGALCAAIACALLARLGWPFELFVHFRVQYAAAAVLLAVMLLGWQRRWAAATLAVLLAGWQAWPLWSPAAAPVTCAGPQLRAATVNVNFANTRRERALDWLAAQPADMVVVQEANLAWAVHLAGRRPYTHRRILGARGRLRHRRAEPLADRVRGAT